MEIRLGKPKRVSKNPWKCGIRMGQGCPRRKKWANEARKQWNGSRKPKVA